MTGKQENKLSMYFAVQGVCNENNTVWGGLPAYVSAFGDFEGVIQSIQGSRLVQEKDTKGVTQDKASAVEQVIEKALEVSTAVHAYATDTNNNELREKINYSPSDLKGARDTILIDKCQLIHDEANNVIGSLGDYGVLAADLTDLQSKIDAYEASVAKPREAITNRSTATTELENLLKEGDNILDNRLDKLMSNFKQSDPVFYSTYFNARLIVDLGRRGTADEPEVPPEISPPE